MSDVKSAYKILAMEHHPDTNSREDATALFIELNDAYEILSDPEARAKYDLFLSYETFQGNESSSMSSNVGYSDYLQSTKKHTKARSSKAQVTRDEKYGRIISFAFLLVIVLGTVSLNWWQDYLKVKEKEAAKEKRAALLGTTFIYYQEGEYRKALESVDILLKKQPQNSTIISFKKKVLKTLHTLYEETIAKKKYDKAFFYLLILKDFEKQKGIQPYYDIAHFYEQKGDIEGEVQALKEILTIDKNQILAYKKLGAIYYFRVQNNGEAIFYYKKAAQIAINYYIQKYGKAYPLLVEPTRMPSIHAIIFHEQSQVLLAMGNYEKALSSAKWANFLNLDNKEVYPIMGMCSFKMGNKKKACEYWKLGTEKSSSKAKEMLLDFCK